jgi:hypothetical protein
MTGSLLEIRKYADIRVDPDALSASSFHCKLGSDQRATARASDILEMVDVAASEKVLLMLAPYANLMTFNQAHKDDN